MASVCSIKDGVFLLEVVSSHFSIPNLCCEHLPWTQDSIEPWNISSLASHLESESFNNGFLFIQSILFIVWFLFLFQQSIHQLVQRIKQQTRKETISFLIRPSFRGRETATLLVDTQTETWSERSPCWSGWDGFPRCSPPAFS